MSNYLADKRIDLITRCNLGDLGLALVEAKLNRHINIATASPKLVELLDDAIVEAEANLSIAILAVKL